MNSKRFDLNRRIVSVLIFAVLLLLICACAPTESRVDDAQIESEPEILITPMTDQVVVIVDIANLRSGPGVEYETAGSLSREELLDVNGVSPDGDWFRLAGGNWISADFVRRSTEQASPTPTASAAVVSQDTATAPPTTTQRMQPTMTPSQIPAANTPVVEMTSTESIVSCVTNSDVFLLSGPGNAAEYPITGSLPLGREVMVLGGNRQNNNHTYYKIQTGSGEQGWLPANSCPVLGNPVIETLSYPLPFTPTQTLTPSPVATLTPTPSPTASATLIAQATVTPSPTSAASPPPADTPTLLPQDSPTPSPTSVASPPADTPTPSPTSLPQPVATDTPTLLPQDSPTPSATVGPAPSQTPPPGTPAAPQ